MIIDGVSRTLDDKYGAVSPKIKVAVRIRPFNEKEIVNKSENCVDIIPSQKQVIMKDKDGGAKGFVYDFVYNSVKEKDGTQEKIFRDLRFFIDNAIMGYNSSVFAYGQTGSGKTFTMMGTPKSPGLIPRGCETLFSDIKKKQAMKIEVDASYLEIYMDKIYDLLAVSKTSKRGKRSRKADRKRRTKLPIRFNAKRGAYVEGLTTHTVASFSDIKALMDAGLKNRTIAETGMNRMSSRSHCIFTLTVKTEMRIKSNEVTAELVTASINLIDLAGSERVNKTGVFGTRLEELKKINKSLSALGDVISALSQNHKFVPYNNSVLTTLLKESLGGNSKTIMIATISPTMENFQESLSTLRYASRVKKISTHATRNLGEHKAVIEAALRAEIARLKKQLSTRGRGNVDANKQLELTLEHAQEEHNRFKLTHEQKVRDMRCQLAEMEEKFRKFGFKTADDMEKNKLVPQLRNISADPVLTGNLVYFIDKDRVVVGADYSSDEHASNDVENKETPDDHNSRPDIVLVNEDYTILREHAVFERQEYVEPKRRESTMNLQEWSRLFAKCDDNNTGHLKHFQFKRWLTMVIGKDDQDVQMMQLSQFEQICYTLHASPQKGLTWNQVLEYFGLGDHISQVKYKEIDIHGIPLEKLQGQNGHRMVKDLREHILHSFRLARTYRKGATLCIVFKKQIYESDIRTIEVKLRDLLRDTPYASRLKVKPVEVKELKYKVMISNPDPNAPNLMIFVNGERVSHQPILLKHMDKVIFGSKHVFQFINPTEADGDILEIIQKEKNLEVELQKKSAMNQTLEEELHRVKKQLNSGRQPGNVVMDELKRRLLEKLDESTNKVVELETEIKRMEGQARRAKQKMLEGRNEFMRQYRALSAKVQAANTMSMDLGKMVNFQIIVLPYYDPQVDSIQDRLMISRSCHMTNPELHVHMLPEEFENILEMQLKYYEVALENPDEDVVLEQLGEDPFIPGELNTLFGEAVFRITHDLPSNEMSIDILSSGEKVGSLFMKLNVERLKSNQKKRVTKTSRMKGRSIELTLEILGIELGKSQEPVHQCFVTYCFVEQKIHAAVSERSATPSRTHCLKHRNLIAVPKCENVFLKFLGTGVRMRVWTAVSFPPFSLPQAIFYKIFSRKIELTIRVINSQDEFRIAAQTGMKIFKIKSRLEKQLECPPDSIMLHFNDTRLDDEKTLADYEVSNGETLTLALRELPNGGHYRDSDAAEALRNESDPSVRQMIHLLENPLPKTFEDHKEENIKLRKLLREALDRIYELRQNKSQMHKSRRNLLTKKKNFLNENVFII